MPTGLILAGNIFFTANYAEFTAILQILVLLCYSKAELSERDLLPMLHSLATRVATIALNRRLICKDRFAWCVYCLEKLLLKLLFVVWLILLVLVTKRYVEIIAFLTGFLPLRSKLGGWHAKRAWVCQVVSFLLILGLCCVLSAYISNIPNVISACIAFCVLIAAFIAKPVYSPQLHFDSQIRDANFHKKNKIILIIFIVQIICFVTHKVVIFDYLTLGVLIPLVSLLIEHIIQHLEGGETDESMGKSVPQTVEWHDRL